MLSLENAKAKRINLIYEKLLQSPLGLCIGELAKELGVSTKTIQRDFDNVLSHYGAKRDGRRWRLDYDYLMQKGNDNEQVIASILNELAKNSGNALHSKAQTLLNQTLHHTESSIFVNLLTEKLDENDLENFKILESAVRKKSILHFAYQGHQFEVKPLKITFFDGFWYLLALDIQDDDTFKKFHIKTIKTPKIKTKKFELSFDLEEKLKNANSIWFDLENSFEVELHIDAKIKKYFLRKPLIGQKFLGEENDGSITIRINITNEMEILPLVFSYIPFVKVLSPEWLRKDIKKIIKSYIKEL